MWRDSSFHVLSETVVLVMKGIWREINIHWRYRQNCRLANLLEVGRETTVKKLPWVRTNLKH